MSEETLFHEALAKPPAERAAFLEQACAGQSQLRAAVEALLAAHEASGSLLDRPAAAAPLVTGEFTPEPDEGPPGANAARLARTADYHPHAEPGAIIAGRYTLQEKIGEGGMGEVWVAKQTEPVKRRVALKLIKAGMDTKAVLQRFDAERQALAMMDHPNIARVLDGGLTGEPSGVSRRVEAGETRPLTRLGTPFFVMELVNGLPLTKFCDEAKLGIRERLELFTAICQAVQHAHQKGIIHRDLKPSNILVTLIDARPVPKVIDFGVAKAIGGKLLDESLSTQFGAVVGTLEYMAPEQAGFSGSDIDTRADIYSLGVILYELLTGLRPIDGKRLKKAALTEMIRIIQEDEPSKPSTRLSTDESLPSLAALRQTEPKKLMALLRGELDWVVMKCLEKQRERRYETANGLARDIQRYLADEVVEARPPSAGYRLKKFVRRHKGQVIAASLVLLALLGGMVGTSIGMLQAQSARAAESERAEAEKRERLRAETAEADAKGKKELAEANERKAQKRLTQIEKANDILGSIFENLDPKEIAKAERPLQAILVEKLDKAVAQLEGESIGDPLVVAAMQAKFGASLLGLGEPGKAIVLMEKARATRQAKLGPEHADTLTSMNDLAAAYHAAGKRDQALPLWEETLKLRKAKQGADHPDALISMSNLAGAYWEAGKLDLALPLFEETLKLMKAKLGPEHPDTLTSMNNLAGAYRAAGKLDLALPHYEETLKLQKAKLGPEHPDTFNTMNNLAAAYREAGKLDLALPLFEETLKLRKAKLGHEHPDTLKTMNSLAVAYWSAKQLDKSIPLFEETLKRREAKLGRDHPETLGTVANLGVNYRDAGRLAEAVPLLEEALKFMKAKLGPEHPQTLNTMGQLASAYHAAGKLDQALPLWEETLKLFKAKLGPEHPDTLTSMNNLARAYYAAGKLVLALPLFEETLKLRKAKLGPEHSDTLNTMNGLAVAYDAHKQFDKAELLHRERLHLVKQKLGGDSPAAAGALASLGDNLLHQKKWTDAEPLLRECLAIREKKEPDAWTTFNTKLLLGAALLGQKKYADAEPLLLAGYEGLKQREKTIPAQSKVRLPEAIERLVQLYEALGKKDDAAKWRQELAEQKTLSPTK